MWQETAAWRWIWLWQSTDGFVKAIFLLLSFMLLHACILFAVKSWKFTAATMQLSTLSRIIDAAEGAAGVKVAISPASATRTNILARVMAAGLHAFHSCPSSCSPAEAVEFADRAMRRCGALANAEMKAGLGTLATIAALAPFVGVVGTVFGLLHALSGGVSSRIGWLVYLGDAIARSLVPTALGLVVGVVAIYLYNHLTRRLEMFGLQSGEASMRVIQFLRSGTEGRQSLDVPANLVSTPLFSAGPSDWEAPFDHHRVLFGSVALVWLYVFGTIALACFWTLTHH